MQVHDTIPYRVKRAFPRAVCRGFSPPLPETALLTNESGREGEEERGMDEFISGYIRSAREEYARYQGSPPPLWAHEPSPIRPSMDRQWCVSQRRRAPLCNLRRQPDVTRRDPPSSSSPSKNHPPPSKERKKKKEERIKILERRIYLIYIDRTKRLSCYYINEISNISFEQHHENFVKICSDQRLFNVKETTQRVTLTVRGEAKRIGIRILEGRGYN